MASRVAVIGIIIENKQSIEALNKTISMYSKYIVGRMGIPYQRRNISLISIYVDAPSDIISALSGKLGRLEGISCKTAFSSAIYEDLLDDSDLSIDV